MSSLVGLAAEVACRERSDATSRGTTAELRDVQLVLHHWHLPLLDDADLVRYDPTNELVTITDEGVAIVDRIGDLPGSDEGVRVA